MQQKAYSADCDDVYQNHRQKIRIPSSQHPLEGVVVTQSKEAPFGLKVIISEYTNYAF